MCAGLKEFTVKHDMTKYASRVVIAHKHSVAGGFHALPPVSVSGARCSSVVRAFAHGAMCRRIDPSWNGPIELFLVPASAPRLG